jgi:hypothetical protein
MRKAIAILTVLAAASWASADTIWGVSDDWSGNSVTEICSWDGYTGVFIQTPVHIPEIEHTWGLAVYQTKAYIAARVAGVDGILHYDLSTMTSGAFVPQWQVFETGYYRGLTMSLDGTKLYAGGPTEDRVWLLPTAGTGGDYLGGPDIRRASMTGDYQYWSALPGYDPTTGIAYACWNHTNFDDGDFEVALTFNGTYNGGSNDQPGSQAFREDGVMLHNHVVSYTIDNHTGPLGGAKLATPLYDLQTVNSYTFLAGGGMYGMSPVFVPEPATVGLLVIGGLGVLLRKRR